MEQTKGYKVDGFPLENATKIEDIIFYDEPILSHYKHENQDYLYYNVDETDNYNTFLVFHLSEYSLYKLVAGKSSLRETIKNSDRDIFVVDIDFNGNPIKTIISNTKDIFEEYMPDDDSVIEFSFVDDSQYAKLIRKHSGSSYIENLREKAFYLKFSPENGSMYGSTVGLKELTKKLLPKFISSYENYLLSNFENNFKNLFTESKTLNKVKTEILTLLEPRVVDLSFSSFEVGIAQDTTMLDIDNKSIREWAVTASEDYKQEILEADYNNPDTTKNLLKNYTLEQRKKILEPLEELSSNKQVLFTYKRNKSSKYIKSGIRSQVVKDKILPVETTPPSIPEEKDYEFVNLTLLVEKGKTPKKVSTDKGLFTSSNNNTITLTNDIFESHGCPLVKVVNLELNAEIKGDVVLFSTTFEDKVFQHREKAGSNYDTGITAIINKIHEHILNTKN